VRRHDEAPGAVAQLALVVRVDIVGDGFAARVRRERAGRRKSDIVQERWLGTAEVAGFRAGPKPRRDGKGESERKATPEAEGPGACGRRPARGVRRRLRSGGGGVRSGAVRRTTAAWEAWASARRDSARAASHIESR
jgi:hypothetical protein